MPRGFSTLTLSQVISDATRASTRDLSCALPGIVVAYNPATETADIQPAISRLIPSAADPDEDVAEQLPVIPNVKVCWYRARGVAIVPPVGLLPGDPVTLHCCDRDISAWLRSGALSEPDDARTHHWANAIAVPGLVPNSNPFSTPIDAAALASRVLAELSALALQVNALTIAAATHTHAAIGASIAAVPAAVPTILPPTTVIVPVSVASSILKVDL